MERERERASKKDRDMERKRNIKENKSWQSHSSSEPHSCLFRPMTCSKMTHALTGWICLDASHMKHKRRGGAASDLYWCRLAKGGNQPYMSNLVNFPRVLCGMVR